MKVILNSVYLFEDAIRIVISDGADLQLQEDLNTRVDDLTSVFGRKRQVVVTEINGV